jgi:hypothetical protein
MYMDTQAHMLALYHALQCVCSGPAKTHVSQPSAVLIRVVFSACALPAIASALCLACVGSATDTPYNFRCANAHQPTATRPLSPFFFLYDSYHCLVVAACMERDAGNKGNCKQLQL